MFISDAVAATEKGADVAAQAGSWEPFLLNMGFILVMVLLFYVLLIAPQQRRFKEHRQMQESLKKGDKVVTAGGLVGKIDKVKEGDEIVIDLGNNLKVTALRSTIQTRSDSYLLDGNDKKSGKKEETKKGK
jgi:preprotein translocase subunit YajC